MLNDKQIKILPHLSDKYKLNLEVKGNKVFRNGQMLNPWQTEELYSTYFPRAYEEFLTNLFIDSLENKIPDEPVKVNIPTEIQPELF